MTTVRSQIVLITGYNTDVEFDGVVYHVQTEDKGLQTPEIVSFVFAGGAILARKRSDYDDLVSAGFDESILVKRLQRQHKLICAAVHAGRIEDLKRMSERELSLGKEPAPEQAAPSDSEIRNFEPELIDEGLKVALLDEPELRAGRVVTLRLKVTRAGLGLNESVPITIKALGTAFSTQATLANTDDSGVATVSVTLPDFKTGRAAILIQAEEAGEIAELRRIILPANP